MRKITKIIAVFALVGMVSCRVAATDLDRHQVAATRLGQSTIDFYTDAMSITVEGCDAGRPVNMYVIDLNGARRAMRSESEGSTMHFFNDGNPAWHRLGEEYHLQMPVGARAEYTIVLPDTCQFTLIDRSAERPVRVVGLGSGDDSWAYEFEPLADCRVIYVQNNGETIDFEVNTAEESPDEAAVRLRRELNMEQGAASTTVAVRQRREPYNYEWLDRHHSILKQVAERRPRAVIIGNSITHYWGGVEGCKSVNGGETWASHMEPAGFVNLGCGWDRIENVLWRVQHGELDGFDAERIVLMIGTNNFGLNTDDEIVDGLQNLIANIRLRQPAADIKVIGILPRHDGVEWTVAINPKIEKMAAEMGCRYANPGRLMLRDDGSLNSSLYLEGLHPNDAGYAVIVDEILAD